MHDGSADQLAEAVRDAFADGTALDIRGGGSKRGLLAPQGDGAMLPVANHSGIVSYRPEEMVITARAGTRVEELVSVAADAGQQLAFEPLQNAGATLGGTLASGLSGPARPWRGGVRDAVLGVRLINGRGEQLRFGGEVMKNVAGYDVSRLQCGALGTLGVITEASLRLLPQAASSGTLRWALSAAEALAQMRECARYNLPISGACWYDGQLYLRLEGHEAAVTAARQRLAAGSTLAEETPWQALREFQHPALAGEPLWYVTCAAGTPLDGPQPLLIDWAGGRRIYRSEDASTMHEMARRGGGHARCFRAIGPTPAAPIPGPLLALLGRLKHAMDPGNVLNPHLAAGPAAVA